MTSDETNGGRESIRTSVEPALKKEIRVEAAEQGISMAEFIRRRLHDWADDEGLDYQPSTQQQVEP